MRETEPNHCVLDFADEHGRHAHLEASYPDEAGSTTASRTGRRDKGTRLSSQRSYFPLKGPYIHEPRRDGDHWERTLTAVDNHDTQMCQSWKEEIDMLLVFVSVSETSVGPDAHSSAGRSLHSQCHSIHGRIVSVAPTGPS